MCAQYIARLAYASGIEFLGSKQDAPENSVHVAGVGAEAFMPLGELIDIGKEIARLEGEAKRLEGEIKRSEGLLSNSRFVDKAPANVVQEERDKLTKYRDMLAAINQRLTEFKK
jgi:valyl-tRNA synthetase